MAAVNGSFEAKIHTLYPLILKLAYFRRHTQNAIIHSHTHFLPA